MVARGSSVCGSRFPKGLGVYRGPSKELYRDICSAGL